MGATISKPIWVNSTYRPSCLGSGSDTANLAIPRVVGVGIVRPPARKSTVGRVRLSKVACVQASVEGKRVRLERPVGEVDGRGRQARAALGEESHGGLPFVCPGFAARGTRTRWSEYSIASVGSVRRLRGDLPCGRL